MSSARAFAFTAMPVSPVVCLASSALVAAKAIAISMCAAGSSAPAARPTSPQATSTSTGSTGPSSPIPMIILVPEGTSMSALTVQVLRLSLSLGSVTAVNLRRFVCGAQGSLDR